MSLFSSSLKRFTILAAALAPVALVTGCANMVGTASEGGASTSVATMSGSLHGGNQPISGSTVSLYAVGTTGYGSLATLFATTTSANDAYGSFQFNQVALPDGNTTGIIDSSAATYACVGNPQMYIVAKGGSTQGPGSPVNTNAAFIIALGKCNDIASAFVNMNEVTTVATLAALQQYFNPSVESFGYPSTAQAALGYTNGVATIANLADVVAGAAKTSIAPTSNVAGVTMTGVPEYQKINTFANILASCVNTASSPGAVSDTCTRLFANAVPPPSAAVTSQPGSTYSAAIDTVQAAYYMLVNPTNSQDPTVKTHNLYILSSPAAPFQPTVAAQPLDWTIGITYTPSGTCTNANAAGFLASAEDIAVDANGNVWFNNGAGLVSAAGTNALSEISSTGAPTACLFGNIPVGRGLTIDIAGNVWTTGSSTATTTTSLYEALAGGGTLTWPTVTGLGGVVADGAGNIFTSPYNSATPFQEYVGAATATTTSAPTTVGTNVASSTGLIYLAADSSDRIYNATTNGDGFYQLYPGGTSPVGGYTLVDLGSQLTTAVANNDYGTAIDASGNIFGGSTCCTAAASNTFFKVTPGASGTAAGVISAKFLGGLVAPRSTAVDGAGNVWAGMGYPVDIAVTGPPAIPAVFALAEVDNGLTVGLSPNGVTPSPCQSSGSDCPTNGGFQKAGLGTVRSLAIDPSGNVWAASNVSTSISNIVEIVGQAVPVVTPLSVGAKNNTLGTKP